MKLKLEGCMVISSQSEIEAALADLQAHKQRWATLPVAERIDILGQVSRDLSPLGERWVAAGLTAKGFPTNSMAEAEEWLFFAAIVRALRLLRESLQAIAATGRPPLAGPVKTNDGQLVVGVFPQNRWDRLLLQGVSAEVWQEPGVTEAALRQNQARFYQAKEPAGKVALVLGAGNASMLPVIDTLHKLFVEGQVVILKPNPVNAYLGPLIAAGLDTLVRRGFLRIVYGGAAEGDYLCRHPAVAELHLTGSIKSFEAITFGLGAAGEQRKAARTPRLSKRFTAELGNVSPIIVVPGPWRAADIQDQAEQIATWFVANAGFGCLIPRLIIQQRAWPLREKLLQAIEQLLAKTPTRPAYYPGAIDLHQRFVAAHPEAHQIGPAGDGRLPWTFITNVDANQPDDICFRQEAFCSLMAETALGAADAPEFIDQAVEFANTTLWGTLNATLIVHPRSLAEPAVAAAVERAIARLRYGTVTINMGAFAAYYLLVTPWGGFPGQPIDDIQSGSGKTGNVLMFDQAQKSVVRGPFHKRLDVIRIASPQAAAFCRRLASFEEAPSLRRLLPLIGAAVK
jgi:acyl-CoA reductase-like NAD-dependent aldehyde dehydrogenase